MVDQWQYFRVQCQHCGAIGRYLSDGGHREVVGHVCRRLQHKLNRTVYHLSSHADIINAGINLSWEHMHIRVGQVTLFCDATSIIFMIRCELEFGPREEACSRAPDSCYGMGKRVATQSYLHLNRMLIYFTHQT